MSNVPKMHPKDLLEIQGWYIFRLQSQVVDADGEFYSLFSLFNLTVNKIKYIYQVIFYSEANIGETKYAFYEVLILDKNRKHFQRKNGPTLFLISENRQEFGSI